MTVAEGARQNHRRNRIGDQCREIMAASQVLVKPGHYERRIVL